MQSITFIFLLGLVKILFYTIKNENMSYLKKGMKGYFGRYTDNDKNVIVYELNRLIDEYNVKINSFETEFENNIFHEMMCDKIKKLYKTII